MFYTALILGLVGSLHCLGMCGPIVLIVPKSGSAGAATVIDAGIYHAGRLSTYLAMGLIAGLIGGGFAVFTGQQTVSLVIGILILLFVLLPKGAMGKWNPSVKLGQYVIRLHSKASELHRKHGLATSFLIGAVNGLLPCGLVYAVVAGAIALSSVKASMLFMLGFGSGTVPMMLGVHLASNLITIKWRNRVLKLMPVAYGILGILFVLRGLDLGIPFLSPELGAEGATPKCH